MAKTIRQTNQSCLCSCLNKTKTYVLIHDEAKSIANNDEFGKYHVERLPISLNNFASTALCIKNE
jgi:hypothetical protein